MQTIKELLNQIKWDKSLDASDYIVYYEDYRVKKLKQIKYDNIKKIEGEFMTIEKPGGAVEIPIHLVREVRMKEKLVWRRNP